MVDFVIGLSIGILLVLSIVLWKFKPYGTFHCDTDIYWEKK